MGSAPDKDNKDAVFSSIDCCYNDEESTAMGDEGANTIALSWRDSRAQMLNKIFLLKH